MTAIWWPDVALIAASFKGITVVQASVFGFAHKGYYAKVRGAGGLLRNRRCSVAQQPSFSCATAVVLLRNRQALVAVRKLHINPW